MIARKVLQRAMLPLPVATTWKVLQRAMLVVPLPVAMTGKVVLQSPRDMLVEPLPVATTAPGCS